MNWLSLVKAIPALISFATKMLGSTKTPPKRVEDILGPSGAPTRAEEAKSDGDLRADEKYGK